jgi:cytochrome c peroxidase
MRYISYILFSILTVVFTRCKVDPEIKPELPADNIRQVVPQGWPQPVYQFQNNPLSPEGFVLGRTLFYEKMLSRDNTISCGSCHQQFAAFAHSEHSLSHGIDGLFGIRNSPPLFNLNWHPSFMWDGGVNHIEVQPLAPITNPVEMDDNMTNVISKLSNSSKYKSLFKNAFGTEEVNTERIFKSLAQFMGMLYSYKSKYDLHVNGAQGGEFSAQQTNGYNLFKAKCSQCHTEPLLTDFSFRNNGLSINPILNDSGRAHITSDPNDRYKFKVPTLRNILQTAPYMHDGRFTTLKQVLDHYHTGVQTSATLDPLLLGGIVLTEQEKLDIISFLGTLSDYSFLYDERFKDPN